MRNAAFGMTEFEVHAAVQKPGKGVVEDLKAVLNMADDQQLNLRREEGWKAMHVAVVKPGKGVPVEDLMKALDTADDQQLKLSKRRGGGLCIRCRRCLWWGLGLSLRLGLRLGL